MEPGTRQADETGDLESHVWSLGVAAPGPFRPVLQGQRLLIIPAQGSWDVPVMKSECRCQSPTAQPRQGGAHPLASGLSSGAWVFLQPGH